MKKLKLQKIYHYVESQISVFHQKRLDYVQSKVDLLKILKQKNPYLLKAKNILTAQDLIKGFLDAFLQSQEETLFGDFMEGLAIFVCDKVYGARKSQLTGIDLEFEKEDVTYIVEIKAGWNWGNASQIRQLKINFKNAKEALRRKTGKKAIAINGCCFGKNNKPDKGEYLKLCGQNFWEFISGNKKLYLDIIEPIGYKAKQRNEEFKAKDAKARASLDNLYDKAQESAREQALKEEGLLK
jgi:hypothetical protein